MSSASEGAYVEQAPSRAQYTRRAEVTWRFMRQSVCGHGPKFLHSQVIMTTGVQERKI